jgi:hypothetical protein
MSLGPCDADMQGTVARRCITAWAVRDCQQLLLAMCIYLPLLLAIYNKPMNARLVRLPSKRVLFAVLRLWQPLPGVTAAWSYAPGLAEVRGDIQTERITLFCYIGWRACMIQVKHSGDMAAPALVCILGGQAIQKHIVCKSRCTVPFSMHTAS